MRISVKDGLNNTINLLSPPRRIVSLVPSQTELLYSLGLDEEVVGITKFCVHPQKWFRSKQRAGGTKTVKIDLVNTLKPDLIIANKEENVKEQIEELQQIAPVWVSDINTLDQAVEMIASVGKLVDKQERANELTTQIKEAFCQITPVSKEIKTAYLIWKDPYMTTGGDTFIHDMITRCGLTNIFKDLKRYPQITIGECSVRNTPASSVNRHQPSVVGQLSAYDCQLLLLSSEPYPFKQKHVQELQLMLPATKIILADGEMFSWYGSRLLYSAEYFRNLISQIQE